MSDENIIRFSRAKKELKKARKQKQAAQNRIIHGRTKTEKQLAKALRNKDAKTLLGHKLEHKCDVRPKHDKDD